MDTDTVIESLAAKLDAADLDDNETELLRTLITGPAEVEGFATPAWGDVVRLGASTKPLGGVGKPLGGDDPGW